MFSTYFEDFSVRPDFEKEFVSLCSGWLGESQLHQLGKVTEKQWSQFNKWIEILSSQFDLKIVDLSRQTTFKPKCIESALSNYQESMSKDSSKFLHVVIPELECIVSEDWDYTDIIWHKNNGAIESLGPSIKQAGLQHFSVLARNKEIQGLIWSLLDIQGS